MFLYLIILAYDHSERYRRDLDFNVTSGDGGMIRKFSREMCGTPNNCGKITGKDSIYILLLSL